MIDWLIVTHITFKVYNIISKQNFFFLSSFHIFFLLTFFLTYLRRSILFHIIIFFFFIISYFSNKNIIFSHIFSSLRCARAREAEGNLRDAADQPWADAGGAAEGAEGGVGQAEEQPPAPLLQQIPRDRTQIFTELNPANNIFMTKVIYIIHRVKLKTTTLIIGESLKKSATMLISIARI